MSESLEFSEWIKVKVAGDGGPCAASLAVGERYGYFSQLLRRRSFPNPRDRLIRIAEHYGAPKQWIDGWCQQASELKSQPIRTLHARYPKGSADLKDRAKRRYLERLDYISTDQERPLWQRWMAERMSALDISQTELARRTVKARNAITHLLRASARPPQNETILVLESELGQMPAEVIASVRATRSELSGGRVTWRRTKWRIKKCTPRSLAEEVWEIGKQISGWPPSEIEIAIKGLTPYRPVGTAGYEIYRRATAALMVRKRNPDHRPLSRRSWIVTPKYGLAKALQGLEAEKAPKSFQCQACGHIWRKTQQSHKGILCGPCWRAYQVIKLSWMRQGSHGWPPPLPKRTRIIDPAELKRRVTLLLKSKLRIEIEGGLSDLDRKHVQGLESRIRESTNLWCKRIAANLDLLNRPQHLTV